MKKYFAILSALAILLCCLSACVGKSDYAREKEAKEEAIYQRGYDAGYEDGHWEGYDNGYDEGYYDGERDGEWLVDKAIFYAGEKGGWHPEEAWMIIEAYRNKEPLYGDSIPSEQDYEDAVNSLIFFFDYFYSKNYD